MPRARTAAALSAGLTADGKVILNLATITDLRKLPGIGQKRAQAILDLRQKLGGRFRKLTDLLRVKGIGVKRLAKLKDKMVLDPPHRVDRGRGGSPSAVTWGRRRLAGGVTRVRRTGQVGGTITSCRARPHAASPRTA